MKISSDDVYAKILTDAGLSLQVTDDEITVKPEYLKLQSIHIKQVRRGHIKSTLKPLDELTDDDIFWVNEPPVVTAITEDGDEINVYLSNKEAQVVYNYEVIDPRQ